MLHFAGGQRFPDSTAQSVYTRLHSCIFSAAQKGCTEYRIVKGAVFKYSELPQSFQRRMLLVMQVFHQRIGSAFSFITAGEDEERERVRV